MRASRPAGPSRSAISGSLTQTYVFLAKNDVVLDPTNDDAYELVVAVAAGDLDDVAQIARTLGGWVA